MWEIAKEFSCDYGHRVWNQKLNVEYALDAECACQGNHGHLMVVKVFLKSSALNNGMVTDFKHLNWFKKLIDEVFDHRMVLDINDPSVDHCYPCARAKDFVTKEIEGQKYYIVNPKQYEKEERSIQVIYERLTLLDFVPTSENISKWLFEIAKSKMMKIGVEVSRIQFFETPKSQSNYIN